MTFEGFADAHGARLSYSRTGQGSAVVLIHAGVADRRMWDPLSARLADRCELVAFDLRGFGRTEYPPGPYSPAEDVFALVDALGLEEVALVGSSFGGWVALEAAVHAPERVRALVLLDAALPGHPPSPQLAAFGAAEDAALEAGDVARATELNVRTWAGSAPEAVQDLVRDMQRRAFDLQLAAEPEPVPPDRPLEERLPALAVPAVVAYGERDLEDFAAIARRLVALLPDATLHPIPGAGHLPALEQPDAVAELVSAVL